jgi:GntR family transcriptional regulator, arabinose operon transcriptional repressor
MNEAIVRNIPKYSQIVAILRDNIENGKWAPGCKIPSECDLAVKFSVAYLTVRQSIGELVANKYLKRIHGRGTFVTEQFSTGLKRIKVIIPGDEVIYKNDNPIPMMLLQGILSEASKIDCEIELIKLGFDAQDFDKFKKEPGTALLLFWSGGYEKFIKHIVLKKIPSVMLGNENNLPISTVWYDMEKSAYKAVKYLIESGHKHIAFLGRKIKGPNFLPRLTGYRKALQEYGLPLDKGLEEIASSNISEIKEKIQKINSRAKEIRATAYFCASGSLAVQSIEILEDKGFRVPEDISVIAFNPSEEDSNKAKSLTAMDRSFSKLGATAVNFLFKQMEQKNASIKDIRLEENILIRKSCAPIN